MIYLRCGYHPDQYPTEREWEARLMMERSKAIKSPSIHYHLAGTKKVQQELSRSGMVEKFLGDKAQIESIRDIFTGLYSLDHVSKDRNTSLAAPRALSNRLQRRTTCKIQNDCQGTEKWPTGSGKGSNCRLLTILSKFR